MEGGAAGKKPYKVEITEVSDYTGDGCVDLADVEWLIKNKKNVLSVLEGDGDFRSEECIELLKEADIVVTNPPFSLFREYVAQLMEYDKKFLIIGNQNAITYKEIFPLIKANKMWLGYSIHSGDRAFFVPDDYELKAAGCGVENGRKYIRVKGVRWFTNLDHSKRHEKLFCTKHTRRKHIHTMTTTMPSRLARQPKFHMIMMGSWVCQSLSLTSTTLSNLKSLTLIRIFAIVESGLPRPKQLTLKNAGYTKDPYARILIRSIKTSN